MDYLRHQLRLTLLLALLPASACHHGTSGRTGNLFVDACLHWTACTTPPTDLPPSASHDTLVDCMQTLQDGNLLPWTDGGLTVTAAQIACLANAGLDCNQALSCVAPPAPAPCPTPTWSCNGDQLQQCDQFSGSRVVTRDCAASGMHCIAVGGEARCGLASCDPKQTSFTCTGARLVACMPVLGRDGSNIGAISVVASDCAAQDATCEGSANAQCVGNGPSCEGEFGPFSCDGDVLVTCDASHHQERIDCSAKGLHCVPLAPNPAGFAYNCGVKTGGSVCAVDDSFGSCQGTTLQYCDDNGNAQLDCKALGYRDCMNGRCVP
jgi:hypothetical protein